MVCSKWVVVVVVEERCLRSRTLNRNGALSFLSGSICLKGHLVVDVSLLVDNEQSFAVGDKDLLTNWLKRSVG